MKKILMSLLILSFNCLAGDGEGTGGEPSDGKLLKPQKPQPVLVCQQVKIDVDGSGVKSVCFVVKGDGDGSGT